MHVLTRMHSKKVELTNRISAKCGLWEVAVDVSSLMAWDFVSILDLFLDALLQ